MDGKASTTGKILSTALLLGVVLATLLGGLALVLYSLKGISLLLWLSGTDKHG